jgi:acetylornithine deacetylase/succinyl-diaminopimelate desuccinylase-like protein
MNNTLSYISQNKDRFLNELFDLLRIPSVSTDENYKNDVISAAKAVKNSLEKAGVDKAEICETKGHPVVYAEKIIDPAKPTVVVYGHYDVQPADPVELWDTDPFEPVIKKTETHPEGAIYARGACDDKGQMFMHVKALEAMIQNDELPCNVKFMIEGEEEVGSPSLPEFLNANKEKLCGDVILISDTSMLSKETPSITTGLRGMSYVEVKVTGPNRDLHSGLYGGAVANPINILSRIIADLHDENNHITIPGFYDDVQDLPKEERDAMADAPFDIEEYKKALGIKEVWGEKGYSTLERQSIRPTLDINGIWGGYTKPGAKTIIPSEAHAKISMRLVPNQSPEKITKLIGEHLNNIAPDYVTVDVNYLHGGTPYVSPINMVEYEAASKAMEQTFNKTPIPLRSGGSIPIVALFEETLKMKSILLGFGLNSDAIHSPNENYGVWNFNRGIETIVHFYDQYSKLKK